MRRVVLLLLVVFLAVGASFVLREDSGTRSPPTPGDDPGALLPENADLPVADPKSPLDGVVITGTVRDADGAPIARAIVSTTIETAEDEGPETGPPAPEGMGSPNHR